MDDLSRVILTCFGILFVLVPIILCIVLWVKLNAVRQQLFQLEKRMGDTARDWWNWANGMTAHVKTLSSAPRTGEAAPHEEATPHAAEKTAAHAVDSGTYPLVETPAKPKPAATPPASQPVPQTSEDRLKQRIEDVRHKPVTPQPVASHPTTPPIAAPRPVFTPAPTAHPSAHTPAATSPSATPAPKPVITPTPTHAPAAHAPAAHAPTPVHAGPPAGGHAPPPARTAPAAVPPAAPRKTGLEAYLGMKLFVVIGAIALALAAIFLVKIGIDKGYFGPAVRDIATIITGLALIGVGQWRRRFEGFWSQGMTAAGIIALFAAFFAATSLHPTPDAERHFLTQIQGFLCLACTTALAVGLSLQDWSGGRGTKKGGFLIATLGLVGGFITPILVNSHHDNVPGLFGYLLLLHVGIVAATRVRGWSILAALAVLFSSAWLICWVMLKPWDPAHGPIYGMFLLASVYSLAFSTVGEPNRWAGGRAGLAAQLLTWFAAAMGLLAGCVVLGRSNFLDLEWAFFAALVAGAFFLGRLRPMFEAMTWMNCAAVLGMLFVWAGPEHQNLAAADLPRLVWWLTGFGIACTLAAYGCQWKSAVPARWAMLTVFLGFSYVAVAYIVIPTAPRGDEWAWLPLAAALLFAGFSVPVFLKRSTIVTAEQSLSFYTHAVLAFLFAAPALANFHGGTLTALWAALLPLAALAVWRLRIPALLIGFLTIAFTLAARGLMLNTFLHLDPEIHYTLFWNPIVWTYGSIILAFASSAWVIERLPAHPDRLLGVVPSPEAISAMLQTGATAAGFLLLTFLVRWYFHDGKISDLSFLLEERGTFAVGWLLMAVALVWLGERLQRSVMSICGQIVGIIGIAYTLAILVLFTNPLWSGEPVGTQFIFNDLLYVFGLPAALCGILAFVASMGERGSTPFSKAAGITGLLLTFVLVSLQVRHGFIGEHLNAGNVTFLEWGTYSVAWMTLGVIALAIGMALNRELIRRAGVLFAAGGLAYAIAVVGIFMSPIFHESSVGTWPVLNHLLYAYGAPLLLALLTMWMLLPGPHGLARFFKNRGDENSGLFAPTTLDRAMRAGIAVLTFILFTTQVRQFFQGELLNGNSMYFIERATYPIVWLLLAGLGFYLAQRFLEPIARRTGTTLSWLGLLWVVGFCAVLFSPVFRLESVGPIPLLNWLLYAYGTPLVLALFIARLFFARSDDEASPPAFLGTIMRMAVALLAFILFTTEVRQFFKGEFLNGETMYFVERATYPIAWLVLSGILFFAGKRFLEPIAQRAGMILAWAGLLFAVVICAVLFSPLIWHEGVGTIPVLNWLLYAYGLPAIAAALYARRNSNAAEAARQALAWFGALSALFLVLVLVTLEVQHAFRIPRGLAMGFGAGPTGEMAAYSLAWAALGGIYLVTGIITRSMLFRWSSLVMMLLTIFKVFLFDLTGLSDIQRVLSLAGLGVSLMALAFIYHRFVFVKTPAPAQLEQPVSQ